MNRQELERILPHRNSMLLLDSAQVLEDGSSQGIKKITGEEFFLDGHFPGNPIVPGVILCEILAQSTCVLLKDEVSAGVTTFFTGLDKVRFKNPVRPGDVFETRCRITKQKGNFYWAEGAGYVDGKLCVKAEFSFALVEA
ncbi:MAG: 3-hydroxyacyl-ACP dehydratase FabZ [Firmicutes bacterium]|nr:3-hydroxyacyl-ACP dehydratase FabZ [Bacillota bacterium]